jgi:acyl-CoA dehydrogenase
VRDGVAEFISVDDFDSEELQAGVKRNAEAMQKVRAA